VDRSWLTRRLKPLASGSNATAESSGLVEAAVLVPVVERAAGPALLLTKRAPDLKDHAGQVCFPGGRIEPEDPDPAATALREAREEVGLAPEQVALLGRLPCCRTGTGFRIHPVVGWVDREPLLCPDPKEVEEIFFLPLHQALDPRRYRWECLGEGAARRRFPVLPHPRHRIWGATARILFDLARILDGRG